MTTKFNYHESIAITVENNQVIRWGADGTGQKKVFEGKHGKAILTSDEGYWWQRNAKQAPNCQYAQLWMGDYPYGSWCWAIRIGNDGSVDIESIETEINGRGESPSDQWVRECKTWVPEFVTA